MIIFNGRLDAWAENTRMFYVNNASSFKDHPTWLSATPWSTTIDFNGDKKKDWVGFLMQKNSNSASLYCICSKENNFTHILIDEIGKVGAGNTLKAGIHPAQPGFYNSPIDGQNSSTIPFQGAEFLDYEKVVIIYYWDGKKVQKFWEAD